jgi:N-acetylglutamate synthase-like GNAT family acetyltransferase
LPAQILIGKFQVEFYLLAMISSNHRVRRATLDDLDDLKVLWSAMQLPVDDLERRLTEFQVVETGDGKVAGALGVQIARQHGWLHSECYQDFSVADDLRGLFLERIRSLASNHGVLRLWTLEKAPFWTRAGFQPADAETLKKLPETWNAGSTWLTLQLKDEAAIVSLEKEMALFMQTERQHTERALGQVKAIKTIATGFAVILGVFVLVAAAYLLLKGHGSFAPPR